LQPGGHRFEPGILQPSLRGVKTPRSYGSASQRRLRAEARRAKAGDTVGKPRDGEPTTEFLKQKQTIASGLFDN
jgi:hypothetical protein